MFRQISLLLLLLSSWTTTAFVPRQPSFGARSSSSALSVAIDTSDIKNGMTVELDDGEPYKVLSFSIMKQARGAAKTTIKFKNLVRGNTIENTYRSGEKFETALIEKKDVIFSYEDGQNFYFMDSQTFEETPVDVKVVGDKAQWLTEGGALTLVEFKDKIIEVVTPSPCVYTIVETEPNVKGNTAQGYTKPATLDCGAVITVPGYLDVGQKVRVDTDKGSFVERVNE